MTDPKKYTVGLYTLGCKVSQYETEAVGEAFERAGYEIRPFDEVCDAYVINTCTVTADGDAKSRKYIRRAIRQNPKAAVAVMGCYSQRSPDEVAAIPGVGIVVGTADKMSLVERVGRMLAERENGAEVPPRVAVLSLDGEKFEPMCITRAPRTRAYVKIEDGCECRCSYCAISDARGPVRSKSPSEVIAEVEGLARGGTREIVLTGIETGSYGADFDEKYDLADLICELNERRSCSRIRLGSMAPELLTRKFVTRVAPLPIMVPHFHVSMQSGADHVLRMMRRRYSRAMALENIAAIRELMPDAMLTADLMVGFPGETEADVLDTVDFVRRAELLDAHVFAYSRRARTPAADFPDQIPEEEKKRRSERLIAVKCAVRDEVLSRAVRSGRSLPVVFETRRANEYLGHSDSYIEVVVSASRDIRSEELTVIPESVRDGRIFGRISENN